MTVKCFYCDGGLRNWQAEDDPWTEHARWFSECGFVRLVKGDEFISKCINKHPPESVQGVSNTRAMYKRAEILPLPLSRVPLLVRGKVRNRLTPFLLSFQLHVISRDRSRTIVREDELQQMMSSPLVHQVSL